MVGLYNKKIRNSFLINVYARRIITIYTEEELLYFFQKFSSEKEPILILGQGTNVLFLEDYFVGTILFNRISGISIQEKFGFWCLHVGAGEIWHNLVHTCLKNQIPGLENLAFIPGCVGSAPIHNIGAYGVELKQLCTYVDVLNLKNGDKIRMYSEDCQFKYRDSIFTKKEFKKNYAITAVGLKIPKMWKPILGYHDLFFLNPKNVTPWKIYYSIYNIRRKKLPDPRKVGNAGSFFKNPIVNVENIKSLKVKYPKIPFQFYNQRKIKLTAVWLIEKCGLKGYRLDQAAVYKKQSLVLINTGNATGNNIANLARYVQKKVLKKFDICLEPEVRCIKSFGEVNIFEK